MLHSLPVEGLNFRSSFISKKLYYLLLKHSLLEDYNFKLMPSLEKKGQSNNLHNECNITLTLKVKQY